MNSRLITTLAALSAWALVAAGCGGNTAKSSTEPAPKPLPVNMIGSPGFSFKMDSDPEVNAPDTYQVTYMEGIITIRDKPRVLIGYRVDPAHPGTASTLLKIVTDTATKNGYATTPAYADGGTGVSYLIPRPPKNTTGTSQYKTAIAKGPVTVTIAVESSQDGDDHAAQILHDKLLASLAFRPDGLSGNWPGNALTPALPLTAAVPASLAKDSYTVKLDSYYLEMRWGTTYKSNLGITWHETDTAAKEFAAIRSDMADMGISLPHQKDLRTHPVLRDSLGTTIDEGFAVTVIGTSDDAARFNAIFWRKAGTVVRIQTNVGNLPLSAFTSDTICALAAPVTVAKTWTWSP